MNRRTAVIVATIFVLALGAEAVLLSRLTQQPAHEVPVTVVVTATPLPSSPTVEPTPQPTPTATLVSPSSLSYTLHVSTGDIGPRLVDAGAIDLERFLELYERGGTPLSADQQALLTEMNDMNLVLNRANAHFLLNFFWALGLTNSNPILTAGMMITYAEGDIGRFASTGGWTIGSKPATDLYASEKLISLTPTQQQHLDIVAANVFRPCCNNPTLFPDCNHGMAMLGLLEMLAAADATEDELFAAAKAANAIWFPAQTTEIALFAEHAMNMKWKDVAPKLVVGAETASASGFQNVHQWLLARSLLPTAPGGGDGCGL